jgi:glycoside/pentoside/hexuronide:cation symporter, GPH family
MSNSKTSCSTGEMVLYGTGECTTSLVMNTVFGFAMICYTDALGLSPVNAGLALSLAIFWDAVSDPLMGHISDNTRSRFGRRHPYVLIGGILLSLTFYSLWAVPGFIRENTTSLFWYMVVVNLILRTALTVFVVPYTALGFEICTDYNGRSKLQGIRMAMNMLANLLGPALAWSIFFQDQDGVKATSQISNFMHMAAVFSAFILFFVLLVTFSTKKHIKDSRQLEVKGNSLKAFSKDITEIIKDKYPRYVFFFIFFVQLGIGIQAALQIYLYEHFMDFGGTEKTFAHGGGMIGMCIGALISSYSVRLFEKKGAVFFGGILSVSSNLILALLFLTGWMGPDFAFSLFGLNVPLAVILFVLFHSGYWFGNGILFPITVSMMADVSEINEIKTGINKDGGYSAVYSFALKMSMSVSSFLAGYILTLIGYSALGQEKLSDEIVWRICFVGLIVAPVISLCSLILIKFYPVNKLFLENLRMENQTIQIQAD